ncbi:MAG: alpha-ketoacid dehydrogenase subunit beta [Deltaproteobacteria bacterium]|nr:alpha-ketoacid dehydrogenase subunit beta [Deltaproteobacteria bacterium]
MREILYRDALNEALRYNLEKDERVFIMGEDVGVFGGIFGVTKDLYRDFGEARVMDTPISETAIVGGGIGASINGMRPVVEIMNVDFLPVCLDQVANQAAKMRYMYGGQVALPMVIRSACGGGRGAAAQHSQVLHALFMHIPGLKIAVPSTPYDAKGLLNTAIADNNPVMFFEDKMLYNMKGPVPKKFYTIPFGEADVKREGSDVTIVATFRMVHKSLTVAEELSKEGIGIEVIDPRTLCPLDKETIIESVKKTGKLITVDEGNKTNGFGSEIAAIVAEEAVEYLQAPIVRVAAPMTPVPYGPTLEKFYTPDEGNIKEAVQKVMAYA